MNGIPAPEDFRRYREGMLHQLGMMKRGVAEIRNLFLNAAPLPHPPDRGTYLVDKAPPAEVLLHPGAADLLGDLFGAQAAGLVGVWLADTGSGIAVNTEGGPIGVLRDGDVAAYMPIVRLAREKRAVAVMPAVLSKEPDGALRLRLGVSTARG